MTAGRYHAPMWTRDGRLVVSKGPPAQHDLVLRSADVEGPEETLISWGRPQYGGGWTVDGRFVLERRERRQRPGTSWHSTSPRVRSLPWSPPRHQKSVRACSPDGRWLAYVSNDSGRYEAFVRGLAPGAAGSACRATAHSPSAGRPMAGPCTSPALTTAPCGHRV